VGDQLVAVTSRSFSRHPVLRAELLDRYPNARFNDEGEILRGDRLVEFLRGCELAITGLEPIDDELLARRPELRVISKMGVGTDMIDLSALERHEVRLAVTPGTNARSVAELVVAFAVSALRRVEQSGRELRDGVWRQDKGRLLSDRTVGLVGFGAVAREVAELLTGFRCSILACDTVPPSDAPAYVRLVELDELLAESDVISLHVPLTPETSHLIDEKALNRMPAGAVLINTARGGLVDEDALYRALVGGRLAAACLDVFAVEPPEGNPLLELPNVLATPHIGGSTEEAIVAMGRAAIAGLDQASGGSDDQTIVPNSAASA
jgi:phosphoglycerate dehydrogenase-like enzyme